MTFLQGFTKTTGGIKCFRTMQFVPYALHLIKTFTCIYILASKFCTHFFCLRHTSSSEKVFCALGIYVSISCVQLLSLIHNIGSIFKLIFVLKIQCCLLILNIKICTLQLTHFVNFCLGHMKFNKRRSMVNGFVNVFVGSLVISQAIEMLGQIIVNPKRCCGRFELARS